MSQTTKRCLGALPWRALFAGLMMLLVVAQTGRVLAGGTNGGPNDGSTTCTITCTVEEPVLWPPNHKLVNVGLDIDFENCNDNDDGCKDAKCSNTRCDLLRKCTIEVWSDEPVLARGSGNFAPDAKCTFKGLLLRSERKGGGDGRVYLIIVKCKKDGNTIFACCTVVVPHDQSARSLDSIARQAVAAETICEKKGGKAPRGFTLIATCLSVDDEK